MLFFGHLVPVTAATALLTLVASGQLMLAGTASASVLLVPIFFFALLAGEVSILRWTSRKSTGGARYIPMGILMFFGFVNVFSACLSVGVPTQPPADIFFAVTAVTVFLMAYFVRPLKD